MKRINQYKKLFKVEGAINLKELKTTYRGLVKEWHPDKFQDEEKKEEAEIKSTEIIDGYHFLVSIAPETKEANLEAYKKTITELGLVYTRYGSSIKELYSIDRQSTIFTESTLYQLRINSEREGNKVGKEKFYILDGYIYIPKEIRTLSGIVLAIDQYELDEVCGCSEGCESAWDKEFICPDSMLEDVIGYTIQNILQTKQIPEDEKPDLNNNSK